MIPRPRSLSLLFLLLGLVLGAAHADVVSRSKWDRDFKFGSSDRLEIQVFRIKAGKPEQVVEGTFKLTGSGYATISDERVKIGGLNMFSALASIESALRRGAYAIGLETKAQISKQNGKELIFVYGQVKRPGVVTVKDGATLSELIKAAGGETSSADLERVSVIYNGETSILSVEEDGDTELKPGAVVKIARGLLQGDRDIRRRFDELEGATPSGDRLKGD